MNIKKIFFVLPLVLLFSCSANFSSQTDYITPILGLWGMSPELPQSNSYETDEMYIEVTEPIRDELHVRGRGLCNMFFGKASFNQHNLTLSIANNINITQVNCSKEKELQESRFLVSLREGIVFNPNNNSFVFPNGVVYTRQKVSPTAYRYRR